MPLTTLTSLISSKRARCEPITASSPILNRRSPTNSACFRVRVGAPVSSKSSGGQIAMRACRSAPRSRERPGVDQMTKRSGRRSRRTVAEARAYFAAGGLGILIGDGRLNYQPERILEAYYAYSLNKWATLSLDYQSIANPGYNTDRGPVSIFATRLHRVLNPDGSSAGRARFLAATSCGVPASILRPSSLTQASWQTIRAGCCRSDRRRAEKYRNRLKFERSACIPVEIARPVLGTSP